MAGAALAAAAHADGVDAGPGPAGAPGGDAAVAVLAAPGTLSRELRLPAVDLARVLVENRTPPRPRADRTGFVRSFHAVRAPRRLRPGGKGVLAIADGSLVWTVDVVSPRAQALRVHVGSMALPAEATVVAYAPDRPQDACGPFEGSGPGGRGTFWTPPVFGDRVRVELRVPPRSVGSPIHLVLDRVLHADDMGEPASGFATKSASACEFDVATDPAWSVTSYGVARVDYVSEGSGWRCSGCLLNDNDPTGTTPWFLTANHCIATEEEANSAVFYWDWRATVTGLVPSLSSVPRTFGATLVVTSETTDMTLLRLTGSVPGGRVMLGWSTATPMPQAPVVGLHHPHGDVMKISYGSVLGSTDAVHDVVWSKGVTEPGSSGSPLFNAVHQVIGQLRGGSSNCSLPDGVDVYGRFDAGYPLLRPYLWGDSEPASAVFPPPMLVLDGWERQFLAGGSLIAWRMDVAPPETAVAKPSLRVVVRGSPRAWARITHPDGSVSVHPRGRTEIADPVAGQWPVELHAADGDNPRWLKIRVAKNW